MLYYNIEEQMDTTANTPINLQNMNRKLRYYHTHKNDPDFQQRMSEAKRRYYQKNKEAIIAKSLARYYANKPVEVEVEIEP